MKSVLEYMRKNGVAPPRESSQEFPYSNPTCHLLSCVLHYTVSLHKMGVVINTLEEYLANPTPESAKQIAGEFILKSGFGLFPESILSYPPFLEPATERFARAVINVAKPTLAICTFNVANTTGILVFRKSDGSPMGLVEKLLCTHVRVMHATKLVDIRPALQHAQAVCHEFIRTPNVDITPAVRAFLVELKKVKLLEFHEMWSVVITKVKETDPSVEEYFHV